LGRFDDISRLFLEAQDLGPEEREAFLGKIEDGALRSELSALLESDSNAGERRFLGIKPDHRSEGLPGPGQTLGPFMIIQELGRGGMGAVFLARDQEEDRDVAIKLLHPLLWSTEDSRGELMHEAEMVGRLEHEAIVPLYGSVQIEGWTILIYRYIPGGSLSEEIERFHTGDRQGRWRIREDAIRELLPIVDALAYAHHEGIWHRDIKPSNILLETGSHAYLADFGLAKDAMDPEVTRSGVFKGSIRYMSPEQARARLRLVDQRSDVFSMGLVLFECLSGAHAFAADGTEHEILERIAHGEARILHEAWSEAPDPLAAICYKALRPAPADRYQSIAQMGEDLRSVLEDDPVSVRLPNWWDRMLERVRRHRVRLAIAGMLVLVAVLSVLVLTLEPEEALTPVLIESVEAGHEVLVQRFDLETGKYGPAKNIGAAPATAELAPGGYRFTVVTSLGEFAEICREVLNVPADGDPQPLQINAVPFATSAVTDGMVRIDAGPFIAGYTGYDKVKENPHRDERIDSDYWIDLYEVTNEEYAAFVDATGHPAPAYFEDADMAAIARHPVVGVAWLDAASYAEWAGKRLPTAEEWERAARGTDGRVHPWGETPADLSLVREWACVGRKTPADDDAADNFAVYMRRASPVGTNPRDLSPEGLYDVAGNVGEWVEDLPALWNDDLLQRMEMNRMWKGMFWSMAPAAVHLGTWGTLPAFEGGKNAMFGFRCARSEAPVGFSPEQ
jgi:serine/threonine protein kinase/formylglycine-generating enzyme required for sulfatase activity